LVIGMSSDERTGQRRFSVASEVFARVPEYRRAVVVAVKRGAPDRAAIQAGLDAAVRARGAEEREVTDVAGVQQWRRAFRAMGLDPTKTRPAVEALIRRARAGTIASLGAPPIDAGTIVTLLASVPVGVHVLDDVREDLALDFATGVESFVNFQGEREHVSAGELVWRAGSSVLTRRWVHKQGRVGSVTDESAVFAVNLDLLGEDDPQAAVELLTRWLAAAGIVACDTLVLSASTPSLTIALPQAPGT
jgi:DNA/RNA-binding domain of Phe-tRNA-synthetase-like protein